MKWVVGAIVVVSVAAVVHTKRKPKETRSRWTRATDPATVSGISRSYLPGVPSYATATVVALASPTAAVILFAAIALFYVLESSLFGSDS